MRAVAEGLFATFLLVAFLYAYAHSDGVFSNMRILMQ